MENAEDVELPLFLRGFGSGENEMQIERCGLHGFRFLILVFMLATLLELAEAPEGRPC